MCAGVLSDHCSARVELSLALKRKGSRDIGNRKVTAPKAGPKKRRAKTEEEMIRAAVAEHGIRKKGTRRASKVNAYSYKAAEAAKKEQKQKVIEDELRFGLRVPIGPSEFDLFKEELPDDAKVFAQMYWHMQCTHEDETVEQTSSYVEGVQPTTVRCIHCGSMRKWQGTKTTTKHAEWTSYCPYGFDMWDWDTLYVNDRYLWRYIHDEVLASMMFEELVAEKEEA